MTKGIPAISVIFGSEFRIGETTVTDGIRDINPEDFRNIIQIFSRKDWGNVSEAQKRSNEKNAKEGRGVAIGEYFVDTRVVIVEHDFDYVDTLVCLKSEHAQIVRVKR